jgi:hypothetical protein
MDLLQELSSVILEPICSVLLSPQDLNSCEAERVGIPVLQEAFGVSSVSFLEVMVKRELSQVFSSTSQINLDFGVKYRAYNSSRLTAHVVVKSEVGEPIFVIIIQNVLFNVVVIVDCAHNARHNTSASDYGLVTAYILKADIGLFISQ